MEQSMHGAFSARLSAREAELKALFLGLYDHNEEAYGAFVEMLRRSFAERGEALRALDRQRLPAECPARGGCHPAGVCLPPGDPGGRARGARGGVRHPQRRNLLVIGFLPGYNILCPLPIRPPFFCAFLCCCEF